jgi:glycosyltransferase involved in cell wall biosynthesis
MPHVTVLIPGYNAEAHLVEALTSILAQTFDDYCVLFVDDGSTDATPEIVQRLSGPRLSTVRKENGGIVSALNLGLSMIDSEWVARFDADDISLPYRLASQLEFAAFTGCEAVSSAPIHIDEAGAVIGHSAATDPYQPDPARIPAAEPYLPHPFLMMKRHLFEVAGGYRPAHYSEDADLFWRICDQCRMAVQREPLGFYRVHSGSVSTTSLAHIRVQAFFGQLAALNHRRRLARRTEIAYLGTSQEWVARASSIDVLIDAYVGRLDHDEVAWIRAATCAKFLIQASWRGLAIPQSERKTASRSALGAPDLGEKDRSTIKAAVLQLSQTTGPRSGATGLLSRLLRRDG